MGLSIPHTKSDNTNTDEAGGTSANNRERERRQGGHDVDGSLLRSVGEVVVTSAHVLVGTRNAHGNEATVVISVGSVLLLAVLDVRVLTVSVGGAVQSEELVLAKAAASLGGVVADSGLVNVGEVEGGGRVDQGDRGDRHGNVGPTVRESIIGKLDNVGAISLVSALTGVTSRVGIRASPLEVNVISQANLHVVGDEVVLGGRVGLDNVATLAANVQVEDTGSRSNTSRALNNEEAVGAVLEGTTVLGGVQGKGEVAEISIVIETVHDGGVGLNR